MVINTIKIREWILKIKRKIYHGLIFHFLTTKQDKIAN